MCACVTASKPAELGDGTSKDPPDPHVVVLDQPLQLDLGVERKRETETETETETVTVTVTVRERERARTIQ
jgi:hypothetical protein